MLNRNGRAALVRMQGHAKKLGGHSKAGQTKPEKSGRTNAGWTPDAGRTLDGRWTDAGRTPDGDRTLDGRQKTRF